MKEGTGRLGDTHPAPPHRDQGPPATRPSGAQDPRGTGTGTSTGGPLTSTVPATMADAGDTRAVVGRLEEGSPQEQVAAAAELLALAKRDRLRCALAGALPVASAVYQTADSGTSLEATTMELLNALLYVPLWAARATAGPPQPSAERQPADGSSSAWPSAGSLV